LFSRFFKHGVDGKVNCSIAICKQLPGKYVFSNSAPNQVYYMLFRFGLYTSIRGFHGSAWRNFINRNLHAADDGGGRLFLPAQLAARKRTSVLHSASRVGTGASPSLSASATPQQRRCSRQRCRRRKLRSQRPRRTGALQAA
jgi:hypothetical protein